MSFETPAMPSEKGPRAWAQREEGVLDRAARLGRRDLPEAQALAEACRAMTRQLLESSS